MLNHTIIATKSELDIKIDNVTDDIIEEIAKNTEKIVSLKYILLQLLSAVIIVGMSTPT